MSDISELEGRIASALDRISKGLETAGKSSASSAPDGATANELIEELEIEKATNARLVASREQQTVQIERQEIKLTRQAKRLDEIEEENARLQNVVAALQDSNAELRAASFDANGTPDMIDSALAAELEEVKAQRAADLEQMDEILGDLAPLLKEA